MSGGEGCHSQAGNNRVTKKEADFKVYGGRIASCLNKGPRERSRLARGPVNALKYFKTAISIACSVPRESIYSNQNE